ncbi:MAG: RHS repeat protein [Puniceicoccaceae bacterium]|nr:MAG: RHS repeat protein [Puniceicoccaceae bacterium]
MKNRLGNVAALLVFGAYALFIPSADAQLREGWHNSDYDPVAASAWIVPAASAPLGVPPFSGSPQTAPLSSGSGSDADAITTEIQALADGLQNNAARIYEYCRNHIEFEAYWGAKKGATLTYLEGSGNAFDTSALMVALLKASGYEDVEYRYGFINVFDFNVQDWLGTASVLTGVVPFPHYATDQDFTDEFGPPPSGMSVKTYRHLLWDITYLLAQGYPGFVPDFFGGDFYDLGIPHVWVQFKDTDGTTYEMDPSYKLRDNFIENVDTGALSESGYIKSTFLNAIGGTTGSNYVENIDEEALAANLEQYTSNVLSWFKEEKTNADQRELIYDGRPEQIDWGRGLAANSINPIDYFGTSWLPMVTWAEIPDQWMLKLEVTFGEDYDADSDTFASTYASEVINTASLSGQKFSLIFSGDTATSYLDETVFETFTLTNATVDIRFKFDHPHGEYNTSNGVWTNTDKNDQIEGKTYEKNDNYAYAFLYGFDPSGRHLRKRQNVLEQYKKQGLADTDWRVRTELLNTMGLTWLYQLNRANAIVASRRDVLNTQHHVFGRMAQEGGFYVDVGLALSASFAFDGDREKKLNVFQASTIFGSALEHALIEQMQGSDKRATSTVKIMQLANEQGIRVYRATPSNWSTIRSTLSSNGYETEDLDRIESFITDPNSVQETALIPADPDIALNLWTGTGYATLSSVTSGMYISGGFNGGFLSTLAEVEYLPIQEYFYSDAGFYDTAGLDLSYAHEAVTTPKVFALDPVDMASGAFILDKEDLQSGLPMPRGLSFSRHYNSNRNTDQTKGLGFGWTHNLDITVTERSAIRAGMGEATIRQMAPYFTGIQVAADLMDGQSSAKEFQAAMLVAKWATDQLLYKGVSITMGNKTIEFVQMPDGSYEPPAGISMTLTKAGSIYTLEQRHGNTYVFNSDGKIATITDPHSNTATFAYNGDQLDTVTDSYGRTLEFDWTGDTITKVTENAGALARDINFGYTDDTMTAFTDPEGKIYSYQYNADNRITHLRDPDNRVIIRNEFDGLGRVQHQYPQDDASKKWSLYFSGYANIEQDPQGGEKWFLFDERGRSTGIINQTGDAVLRSYNGEDHIVSITSPKEEITLYTFNGDNNLLTVTDPLGFTIMNTYDSEERLDTTTDKRGNVTTFTYTPTHLIETVTDPLGHVTTYGYYSDGLVQTVEDAEGKITTTAYDSFGLINTITLHDATSQHFTNNPRGDILTSTDAESRTITNTWNERRQLLTTTAPAIPGQPAAVLTNAYDNSGNLASRTDAEGNTVTHTWNALGKPVASTQPALPAGSNTITTTYDSRDWILITTNSLAHTMTREYDAAQRMTALIDPLNRRSESTYDANGQMLSSTDPLNRVTENSYNDRGEMVIETDPAGEETGFLYDNNGNQTQLTDRRGKVYTFAYDDANRLTASSTPTGKTTLMTYFDNNLVKTIEEPSTQTTTFTYNARNLVASKADPTGTITYGYDDSGLLETVTEGSDSIIRIYDERGRVKTYTNADGDTLQYRYNGNGHLTRITYPDDREVSYTYNARNLLETVTDWSDRVTTYHYDQLGRLTGITRPNGTSSAIERDAADQILFIRESANSHLFSLLRFDYDLAGQITSRFHAPIPDASFVHPTFAGTYDDDNRLLTVNSNTVVHDDDGNMTSGAITATSGIIPLTYNSRNQLTSADGVSYTYDSEGHRRTMTDASGTTRFVIDANANMSRLLVRHNPDGSETYFVYGLGLLYEADEADNTKTYHFDQVGSTIARTDDAGEVIGRAEYSPYGLVTMQTGDMDTPFLYNGQWGIQTDANGLLNMRARYYSPYLMRFINADPIGFSGGQNWFSYVGGDPVSYSDPFGLVRWKDLGRAALGMVVNGIGVVVGVGVAAIPEPSMVTVAAGGTLALKSGYGFGANWQNFTMALVDADPVSTGTLANDVAQVIAPGNQNAQTAATILDLGTDLASGQIIARGAASMVGKSPQAFPSLTVGSVRSPTNLGTGATIFQGASVLDTAVRSFYPQGSAGSSQIYQPFTNNSALNTSGLSQTYRGNIK